MRLSEPKKPDDFYELMLSRFLDDIKLQGYSSHTVRSYRNSLKGFCRWLKEARSYRSLSDVGRRDLVEFCQVLSTRTSRYGRPLSAATKNNYLHALRAFFSYQVKTGFLLTDPSCALDNFRQQQKLPRVPSHSDILKLISAIQGVDWRGVRDRAWVEVFYGSGLRLSELYWLDLVDLSLDEELIHVRLGKGDQDRYVPITPESKKAIEVYLSTVRSLLVTEGEGDGALFLGARGRRMKRHQFGLWLHKYSEMAGLQNHVTPHLLRHACATHLLKNGASLRHIQELLGHQYLSTTQIYTRVEIGDLREVLKRCHPREVFDEYS